MTDASVDPVEFFLSVSPHQSGCWLWCGGKVKTGMGYGYVGGKDGEGRRRKAYAHRAAFYFAHGRWPLPGLVVLHNCDNPICVNPEHLSEGTQGDNNRDAARKGRSALGNRNAMKRAEVRAKVKGEKNPAAKLTDQQAAEVRSLRSSGVSLAVVAKRYGVSRTLVSMIGNGKRRSS